MLASLRAAADLSSEQQSNIESRLTEYHQFCTVADHEMRVAYKLWETSACIYGVDHSHTKTLSWWVLARFNQGLRSLHGPLTYRDIELVLV